MITIYNKKTTGLFPVFYPSSTTFPANPFSFYIEAFTHNGLGALRDFKSNPLVTEVINGEYTLEFEYAKDGWLSEYLLEENIIKAPNNESDQLFRIYYVDKSLDNIKVLAKHIAFDLNDNLLDDVYPISKNGQDALNWVLTRTQYTHGFTGWSDITDLRTARYVRKNMNDVFFNADNSFINTWGGEFEFDNFTIKLYSQRGSNNGLQIRHGKNLTGANVKTDFSTVATRIMPVGKNGLLLPEIYIDSPLKNNYHSPIVRVKEFDIGVDENTTQDQAYTLIRAEVQKLFDENIDLPTVSAKIDFIELSKVKEYENYSDLETASIGDTVKVYISQLNIDVNVRIKKTVYDCLKERFIKLDLGEVTPNYITSKSKTDNSTNQALSNRVKKSEILSTINMSDEEIQILTKFLKLEGYTTINNGFSVDLDGNMICNNATINGATLKLGNDTQIVGEDGILVSRQFDGSNVQWSANKESGYWFLGYNYTFDHGVYANWIEIDVQIPDNFTVESAYITLYHVPVAWDAYKGYCRNLKLYNVINPNELSISGAYASEFSAEYNYTKTEITDAFGVNGFTGNDTTGETEVSSNIASTFSSSGVYKLIIQSSDGLPSYTDGVDDPNDKLGTKTGYVYVVLNVTGYMS